MQIGTCVHVPGFSVCMYNTANRLVSRLSDRLLNNLSFLCKSFGISSKSNQRLMTTLSNQCKGNSHWQNRFSNPPSCVTSSSSSSRGWWWLWRQTLYKVINTNTHTNTNTNTNTNDDDYEDKYWISVSAQDPLPPAALRSAAARRGTAGGAMCIVYIVYVM